MAASLSFGVQTTGVRGEFLFVLRTRPSLRQGGHRICGAPGHDIGPQASARPPCCLCLHTDFRCGCWPAPPRG